MLNWGLLFGVGVLPGDKIKKITGKHGKLPSSTTVYWTRSIERKSWEHA
jgi:hypothetical protein